MSRLAFQLSTCINIVLSIAIVQAYAVDIETVPVGNPGNPGEVQPQGTFGAVPYSYRIGKYEVTNAQYVEFLNAVDPTGANTLALFNDAMSTDALGGINLNAGAADGAKYELKLGRDNKPVVYVSWFDTMRFANWLHNGQGSGDTENGAYTLLGGTPTPSNGNSIARKPGAKWWVPNQNEWYKAAYHKNDGATDNYWDYPTSTDAVPFSDQPPGADAPDPSNTGNFYKDDFIANGYDDGVAVTGGDLTDVGAYTRSTSAYGTYDQGGNVAEWLDDLMPGDFPESPIRFLRGGFGASDAYSLHAGFYLAIEHDVPEIGAFGFRVASVPEPRTFTIASFASLGLILLRRTRSVR